MNKKLFDELVDIISTFPNKKIDFSDASILYSIAQVNRVWPIVRYVVGMQDTYYDTMNLHYARLSNCITLFNKLENANISYAIIKGAYLDKVAYGNRGLRDSKDIDILIERKSNKIIKEFLEEEGFICGYYDYDKCKIIPYSRRTIIYNQLYTHQSATFVKRIDINNSQNSVRIDINNSASWAEDIDGIKKTSMMLMHTELISYQDVIFRVLKPDYFLLELCLHGYRDMNSIILLSENKYSIRLLCDVYYYILSQENLLNLDDFFDIVCALGYGEAVYYIFY